MAAGYRGVDAVFGGHSHTWVAGRVGGVPVLISASNGRAIGSVRLDYDEKARRVTAADPSLDPAFADSITPDPEVSAVVASYEALLGPLTSRVVATAAEPLSRDGMEKPLGSLVCDVIRGAARVDIAMQNPGGVRADVPAGPITVGRLYEVMPFDNTIVTMSLTGAQVRRVLEEALAHGRVMQVSGIRYAFDDSLPEGARLTSVTLDSGSALEAAAAYTLATNDFMASGGDNMETLKSIESVNTNRLVRDAMAEWFDAETAAGRAIHPPPPGRIRDGGRR
jgi:2',3'-cyclic-nucleotide 2'-phosphodiesterase/3'-nucleotidase